MADQLLSTEDYAEIREAVALTFTDTVDVEQPTVINTANGKQTAWSTRNSGQGLVIDLSGRELIAAQQVAPEASAEVRIEALRTVELKDRIKDTNHETGAVRYLQVVFIHKPSREFVRRILCKGYS